MARVERIYRTLLRIYPQRFRTQYEIDAVELFRDRYQEARRRGFSALAWLWLRTVPNVVVHGLLARVAEIRGGAVGFGGGVTLRNAVRGLMRAPGLSFVIVLTLGLGIGANVALYGVLRSVLLKPLPYAEPDRLVRLWETNPEVDDELHGPSPLNFNDWERSTERFESMATWYLTSGTYRTDDWVEEIRSAQVTVDFFRTMGVSPMLGRDFQPEEVTRYGPVMLSHGVWMRLFSGDPSVVGRSIVSSGGSYEIVGVMPADFTFPDQSVETWVAWNMPEVYANQPESRTWRFLGSVARLAPGVSVDEAEEELDRVAAGLAEAYPIMDRGWDADVTTLHEEVVGDVRATLWIAFGAVLFILLIACANVANLLLARAPARSREIAIRTTLGASRRRVATELMAENAVLAGASAIIGLALGRVFIDALVMLDAGRIPRLEEVSIDLGVFAFTALAALGTALVFGVAPVLQVLRSAGSASLRDGVRTTATSAQRRLRQAFVGSQLAIALVLLMGAGLFALSLKRLTDVDPGLDAENVASFRVSLDPLEGGSASVVRYYQDLVTLIEALPGVEMAGASQTLPLSLIGNDFTRPYRPEGTSIESAAAPTVRMRIITPGYVATMGMTVMEGSDLPEDAVAGEPLVALVNQALADRLWPDGDAAGRRFEIDFREGWLSYQVVGVVQDVRHYGLRSDTGPEAFLAHSQVPYVAMHVVAKTRDQPESMFEEMKTVVLNHQPMQPPHNFVSLEGLLSASTAEERFLSLLLSLLAGVGLLLASIGVYGVIAYTVNHRRREIGVRMALGAEPDRIVGTVMRQALTMAALGLVAGFAVVVGVGGVVEGVLFEVEPNDPMLGVLVGAVLFTVAGVAAYVPARRAAWIPPSEAIRAE